MKIGLWGAKCTIYLNSAEEDVGQISTSKMPFLA
jgi:hypothetical protein